MSRYAKRIGFAIVGVILGSMSARAADLVVCGCDGGDVAGEIRYPTVSANTNQDITITVRVETMNLVDTIGFDVLFDPEFLDYVGTAKAGLTGSWVFFQGMLQSDGSTVIVGGFDPNQIPSGTPGAIAELTFRVKKPSAGCANVVISNPREDLSGYSVCSPATGSTSASFDFRPESCPNRIRVGLGRGTMSSAVLGTATFDAADVVPTSVTLQGPGATISPVSWRMQDVNSPGETECDCGAGLDQRTDYVFDFNKADVATAVGNVQNGDTVMLKISGTANGSTFEGADCVVVTRTSKLSVARGPEGLPRAILELEEPTSVRLKVFDITGRLVSTLLDGVQPAGTRTISWDTAEYASGIYFMRYEDASEVETHKVVVIH